MITTYRIVRVHANLTNLEVEVNKFLAEGWKVEGAPFFDAQGAQWCQSMVKAADDKPGQVKLREPKR